MSIKKKFIIVLLEFIVIFSLVFWGKDIFIFYLYTDKNQRDIFYSDNKVASNYDDYISLQYNVVQTDFEKNIDFRFTGMDTICTIDAKEDTTILIKYNCKIFHGKFKAVLIDVNDNIINLIEQNNLFNIFKRDKSSETAITLKKGQSRIKIVGKDAKGILDFKVECNELVALNIK